MHSVNDEILFNSIVNDEELDKEALKKHNPKGYEELQKLEKKSLRNKMIVFIVFIVVEVIMIGAQVSSEITLIPIVLMIIGFFFIKENFNEKKQKLYKEMEQNKMTDIDKVFDKLKYKNWKDENKQYYLTLIDLFEKQNIDYKLLNSESEYKEFILISKQSMWTQMQNRYPFKIDSYSLGGLELEKCSYNFTIENYEKEQLETFKKHIINAIKDSHIYIVPVNYEYSPMQIDKDSFIKYLEEILNLDTELYFTNESFEWCIEYLGFENQLSFVKDH